MAKTKATRKTAHKPPSRKIEDKAQYERFRAFAREMETDESEEAFERAFRKIIRPKLTQITLTNGPPEHPKTRKRD
jgi:hypothetical protein